MTNHETWAFNLHWQNDQPLYVQSLEAVRQLLRSQRWDLADVSDHTIGAELVSFWETALHSDWPAELDMPETMRMFRDEVGDFSRVDRGEVGEAVRELLDDDA